MSIRIKLFISFNCYKNFIDIVYICKYYYAKVARFDQGIAPITINEYDDTLENPVFTNLINVSSYESSIFKHQLYLDNLFIGIRLSSDASILFSSSAHSSRYSLYLLKK